jgi:hypothetical protein
LLVFAFFMMSDPQTAPRAARARVVYGAATAAVAAALLSFQSTEFGIKLAILSSLIVTCALAPLIERWTWRRRSGAVAAPEAAPARERRAVIPRLRTAAANPVALAVLIIVVVAPAATLRLVGNNEIIVIERGLTGSRNPQ